jgi:hypothetical protein
MKRLLLLAFFSFVISAVGAQSVLDQTVTVQMEELSVEESLYLLTDQAGVKITFSNIILPDRLVSLRYRDAPLAEILTDLLAGSSIQYQEIGDQVVLLPRRYPASYTVNGFLKDASTGEFLINANIIDLESQHGTTTNAYGFFSFSLPEGKARIAFSYTGYKTEYLSVDINAPTQVDLKLKPSLMLEPIEIIAHRLELPATYQGLSGHQEIDVEQVDRLPALAGESDLIRVVQLQPGVQTGTDGIGGMHVRGGNNGQNLVMIDGVPVYNINHAAGLFSIFNTNAIRSVQLHKAGFPARYGGRLSSVLDIRTKEGNREALQVKADIGTLAGRLTADGPIVKGKSSFLVSGRMSLIDWYLEPLLRTLNPDRNEGTELGYRFYDLNAKLNYEFSRKDKLYLSVYRGSDSYQNQGASEDTIEVEDDLLIDPILYRTDEAFSESMQWKNTVASLRWNHLISDRLFANVSATYSALDTDINYTRTDSLYRIPGNEPENWIVDVGRYEGQIQDVGLRLDFDYAPANMHYLRFGVNATYHHFTPGVLSYYREKSSKLVPGSEEPPASISRSSQITALEYAAYVEDEFRVGRLLSFNLGLHASLFQVGEANYTALQPRILAQYQAGLRWQLEASFSHMAQYVHLLNNSLLGMPTELWVPSTEEIGPETAYQTALASRWNLRKGWGLSLEAYYKSMDGLLTYSEGAAFLSDWQQNVTSGRGTAYGIEAQLSKRSGNTTGWIGYSLQWADRQFNRVNRGVAYPYRYDRRHEVKAAFSHRFKDWIECSASWVLSSGFAFSFPASEYTVVLQDGTEYIVFDYGEKNENRMPYYHRLDFSTNFYIKLDKTRHTIRIGAYNIYNRQNPLYYQLRTNFVNTGQKVEPIRELTDVTLIPLLPSLSYSIDF